MFGPKQMPARQDEHLPALPPRVKDALKNELRTDALIAYAKKVRDFTLLLNAVEEKMKDQTEFVVWWDGNVRGPGQRANVRDQRHFVAHVEEKTSFTKQQVSTWRRKLRHPDKYRESLYGPTYAKAMAETTDRLCVP